MTSRKLSGFFVDYSRKKDGLRDAKTPFQQWIYTHFRLEITTYPQPFFQFSKNGSKIRLIPI